MLISHKNHLSWILRILLAWGTENMLNILYTVQLIKGGIIHTYVVWERICRCTLILIVTFHRPT
jgi:hypothetical protein